LDSIALAEVFAGGRGKPQGCGLRARKAGSRISRDPKQDVIRVTGGAGGVGGAAASAPNPVAFAGD